MDGASFVSKRDWQVFFRRLVGKNAKEGVFPRFPGFRGALPAPLPGFGPSTMLRDRLSTWFDYAHQTTLRKFTAGNGYAALPIGARLGFAKTAPRPALVFQRQLPR